ncbi:MAG: hypothetical protein ACLQCU_13750 [Acidimicrobiales bacterium]
MAVDLLDAHVGGGQVCCRGYRLRGASSGLVYLRRGRVGQRIKSHLASAAIAGHRQASFFSADL